MPKYLAAVVKFSPTGNYDPKTFMANLSINKWELVHHGTNEINLRLLLTADMKQEMFQKHLMWAVGRYLGQGKSCFFTLQEFK
jgi:hypothetical protein